MAIVFVGKLNVPNYTALSSDVIGGALPGGQPGQVVYFTDTAVWKIIRSDLQLVAYALPVTFDGSVEIGSVHIDQQLAESVALAPYYALKSVSSPGTGVPLMSSSTPCISVTIFPKVGNVGAVYVGTSAVDKDTSQQIIINNTDNGVSIDVPLGYTLDLANFYVDAVNANDGVYFIYFK